MRKTLFFLILLFSPVVLFAAPADVMEDLLAEEKASFGKAAYFVLVAAEVLPDNATPEEAAALLNETGWKKMNKDADDSITLGELSFLIMKTFRLKGGVLYSILPGPRYAARELSYLKFFSGRPAPGRAVSGEEVLRILGRVLDYKGGAQ